MYSAKRADETLVLRGLAASRSQARLLIRERRVRHANNSVVDKASRSIAPDQQLYVTPLRFVSRAGDKLSHLIESFSLPVAGLTALDLGASTGGFTDCLLQSGALRVVAVDVGHSQLHPSLVKDPRVLSLERTNARYLHQAELPLSSYDIVVADLSFISLTQILPVAGNFLLEGGWLGALIKPQFELDPATLRRCKGIVRDPSLHRLACHSVLECVQHHFPSARPYGPIASPIVGGDGNQEYLAAWLFPRQS